jgi:hypothetical protein
MSSWMADGTEEWGGRPVARTVGAADPRRRAALTGIVQRVSVRSGVGGATEAELDDGTGSIVLRWVGRDRIPGVVVGASLTVEGTVLAERGRRVILNPLYRFVPADAAGGGQSSSS